MDPSEALASCERSLRELLTISLRDKFGDNWLQEVFTTEDLARLREKQEVEAKRRTKRGAAAVSASLITYAEFTQLTRLVTRHWDLLDGALGAKKEITVLLDRIEAMRNAVAHSRELLPFEQELMSAIAGEIRNRVTIHVSGQDASGEYFPRVEIVRDSFGHSTETAISAQDQMFMVRTGVTLRPGDVVRFTCRAVDPQSRPLTWRMQTPDGTSHDAGEGEDLEIVWQVEEKHIHTNASLLLTVSSDGQHHRYGTVGWDAAVDFRYKVLPPVT
ncbi:MULTISPECIES: hypothetical protein [unclassified Streptomyces]|uniref:hypothetical protein n=1 Tax=unclassified Streptomyces TaxID=2593676 RepID=UPI002E3322FB|nr:MULTISPECIES: hypothetical protein [unclassified Streptomyces]WUC69227.1 hypothetical protein OG861_33870 [Streptomyces sp. NBC_00539]